MTTIHTPYQLRGYCSQSGYKQIADTLLDCVKLYNGALTHWRGAWKSAGINVSLYDQIKEFTQVRRDATAGTLLRYCRDATEGWGSRSIHIGRGVLRRFDRAKNTFFRRHKTGEKGGYPRYRSSYKYRTIEIAASTKSMIERNGNGKYYIKIKGLPGY